MTETQPEAWLRGPLDGYDPLLAPVAYSLMQAREDVAALAASVPAAHVWERPGGAASIGFHVRHLGGAVDRLFTMARGERLSDDQKAAARAEPEPGQPLDGLAADLSRQVDRALEQLRATRREDLLVERQVGRSGLTTTLGLLVHAAEHATRHVGQATSTAMILAGRG